MILLGFRPTLTAGLGADRITRGARQRDGSEPGLWQYAMEYDIGPKFGRKSLILNG